MKLKAILLSIMFFSCKNVDVNLIYEKAGRECRQGNYMQAQKILDEEIPAKDRDYRFYLTYGMCYMWINPDLYSVLAIDYFEKAYDYNPDKYWPNYYLGVTNYYLLNYKKALEYLTKAKNIFESKFEEQYLDEASPFIYLTDIYYQLGNLPECRTCIGKSFGVDKGYEAYIYIQQGILTSSETDDADFLESNYKKAKLIEPDYAYIDKIYIHQLVRLGEYENAESKIKEFLNGNKNTDSWIYSEYAYLKLAQQDYVQAKKFLDKADALYSTDKSTKRYYIYCRSSRT